MAAIMLRCTAHHQAWPCAKVIVCAARHPSRRHVWLLPTPLDVIASGGRRCLAFWWQHLAAVGMMLPRKRATLWGREGCSQVDHARRSALVSLAPPSRLGLMAQVMHGFERAQPRTQVTPVTQGGVAACNPCAARRAGGSVCIGVAIRISSEVVGECNLFIQHSLLPSGSRAIFHAPNECKSGGRCTHEQKTYIQQPLSWPIMGSDHVCCFTSGSPCIAKGGYQGARWAQWLLAKIEKVLQRRGSRARLAVGKKRKQTRTGPEYTGSSPDHRSCRVEPQRWCHTQSKSTLSRSKPCSITVRHRRVR